MGLSPTRMRQPPTPTTRAIATTGASVVVQVTVEGQVPVQNRKMPTIVTIEGSLQETPIDRMVPQVPDLKSAKIVALVLNQPIGLKAIREKKAIVTSRPDRITNDLGLREMALKETTLAKAEKETKIVVWSGAANAATMTKD